MSIHSLSHRRGALEWRLTLFLLALLVAGGALLVQMPGRILAAEREREYDTEFYEFAELFSEIYANIRERYVDEVDSEQLFHGAINGMFMTLDPHSSWLTPDQQTQLTRDTEGEYSGVGLHITLRDHRLTAVAPIAGGPSARVGVHPWDRIMEIDGQSTDNITLIEAVRKLTGPSGTDVTIKVWREGEPDLLEFTLTREKIHIRSVFSRELEDGIGYVRISKFQDDTAREVKAALEAFNQDKIRGLIVDVRNDSGGLLDRAVEICDLFLPKGQVIVSTRGRDAANNKVFRAEHDALAEQPMVVLVNRFSASASEIFAGAMKDTGRGLIVGPKGSNTFGKGSVQTISALRHSLERDDNGDYKPCAIRLTTAKYYTPSDVSIHETGIEPDIGVEVPVEDELDLIRHGMIGDPSLIEDDATDTAPKVRDDATTSTEPATDDAENPDAPSSDHNGGRTDDFRDIQLEEAVKYLKGVLIYAERQAA